MSICVVVIIVVIDCIVIVIIDLRIDELYVRFIADIR